MRVKPSCKVLFCTLIVATSLSADRVKIATLACPSSSILENVVSSVDRGDAMQLESFAIKNGCKVLDGKSRFSVVGYAKNIHAKVVKIELLDSGETLYTYAKNLIIEQSEDKNIIRF